MDHASAARARLGIAFLLAASGVAAALSPGAVAQDRTGGTAAHRAHAAMPPPATGDDGTEGTGEAPGAKAPATETGRTVSAWLPYWGDTRGAYRDALQHAAQLHTVSPFWYRATSATTIKSQPGAGDRRVVAGLHKAGIKVVPTVNESMDAATMAPLLHDPARRGAHIRALLRLVASRAYDGIDLDYETMATTGTARMRDRVRTGYALFADELCAKLHARGKSCVITVMARTARSGKAYDYARLGKAADRVRIMGYDLHWAEGSPGPLSSLAWYEEFLRYATGTVPRDKLEIAFPGYGWDWTRGVKARAKHLTWKEAEALRRRKGVAYRFDTKSGTPHFTYRAGRAVHDVWYQDARGVAAHLPLLRKYGVRNTGLWALGFEDPGFWKVLRGE
ncbi:glycosyl hydrolase [Streptomyces griseoflavus]|uniref:glycosyl hydrolase family 18 protein n=1 Tax=Streptomyces rimosus TaxID=1927 RepID=UPI0004CBB980|nr:glycosyl hydrolase family 18 protein [Streptomyces rimosus]KOG66372.1 glycosyl hydrolase [Streptomyces griseoflavus]